MPLHSTVSPATLSTNLVGSRGKNLRGTHAAIPKGSSVHTIHTDSRGTTSPWGGHTWKRDKYRRCGKVTASERTG